MRPATLTSLALAALTALGLGAAAPARAGGGPVTDFPLGGTLVIDDTDPNTITFTATGFAGGLIIKDGLDATTTVLAIPGGGPVSVTLPDTVPGARLYQVFGSALLTQGGVSDVKPVFAFSLPAAPLDITSLAGGLEMSNDPLTGALSGMFLGGFGLAAYPFLGPPFDTVPPNAPGITIGPQDGHSVSFTFFNDAVSITFISEPAGDAPTIPEPATLALLGAGLFGLGVARRRKAA